MEHLKQVFAKKLLALRTGAGMTQSELGDRLSYSHKTVSKWERGEAIPDALVLKNISRIFSVTVDYLLDDGSDPEVPPTPASQPARNLPRRRLFSTITPVVLVGIWTVALLLFIIFWMFRDLIFWQIFVCAMPVTAVTLLVLNSVWNRGKGNFWIICTLVISILTAIYIFISPANWQVFLLIIPSVLLVYLSFRTKRQLAASGK